MFAANIVPGQGFVRFTVYEKRDEITPSGRAVEGKYKLTEKQFYGIVANASQREIDQWKQNGHPITHKIVQYSSVYGANATDYILSENGGEFYVQGAKNPAGLNLTNVYYVEQRNDLQKGLE